LNLDKRRRLSPYQENPHNIQNLLFPMISNLKIEKKRILLLLLLTMFSLIIAKIAVIVMMIRNRGNL